MSSEMLFQIVNFAVLPGWLMLAASPWIPRLADLVAGYAIPAALAVVYVALILVHASSVEGASYTTLSGVMAIFDVPGAALGGWVHFLAFDLVVGALIARMGRESGVPFALVLPCLLFCFLLGPVGFLLFLAARAAARRPA